jgi:hypothetical protein
MHLGLREMLSIFGMVRVGNLMESGEEIIEFALLETDPEFLSYQNVNFSHSE